MKYNDLFIKKELPKPLDKEHFNYYVEQYHNGDLEAKDILIEHNIGLVLFRLYKRFGKLPQEEQKELVCIGIEALIEALSKFDLSYNVQFSTYAIPLIDGKMLQFLQKNREENTNIGLEDSVCTDKDGSKLKVEDILSDKNVDLVTNYEEKESIIIIRKLIDTLPSPDREIIILYYGFNGHRPHTQYELADMYNISQAQISRIIKRSVNTLKNILYEQGIIETTRKCNGKYKDNVPTIVGSYQHIILQLQKISERFKIYSKAQILQALQIYISDLSIICSKILSLAFDLDQEYTHKELSIKLNCSEWTIGNSIKKINKKLENKTLFEELSLIFSQITSELKIIKTNDEQSMEKNTIYKNLSNTDNHILIDNLELLKDNIRNNSLFNNQLFEQALSKFDDKDQGIIILKLNNYSIEDISKIFKIENDNSEYITDITRNFLLFYKDLVNKYIDTAIDLVVIPGKRYLKK